MMANIDTSMNRDPEPTRETLLKLRDRMNARLHEDGRIRDYGRPVRIIRSANLLTRIWQQDAKSRVWRPKLALWRRPDLESGELKRIRAMAETGEHLGLERVGLVVGVEEVQP